MIAGLLLNLELWKVSESPGQGKPDYLPTTKLSFEPFQDCLMRQLTTVHIWSQVTPTTLTSVRNTNDGIYVPIGIDDPDNDRF